MRRLRFLSLATLVAGIVLGGGVLSIGSRDAEAAPEDDIQALVAAAVEAWNEGDAETFASLFTAEALLSNFDIEDPENAAEELIVQIQETGPIASATVTDISVQSGNATGIVDIQFEFGFSLYEKWKFYNLPGGWKIGPAESAARPIPEGVPAVDLTLQEYAFVYNEAAIQAADGNFAFSVTNVGQEEHEVVLLSIDSNESLVDLLLNSDPESEDLPEGVGFVSFGGFFTPGSEGTVILPEPLAAGKYGLVCFIPSPEGVPHAFLGMVSEFSVGSGPVDGGGTITPPSTGDAGLLGAGTHASWVVLGLALTLVLGGTAGLARTRVSSGA